MASLIVRRLLSFIPILLLVSFIVWGLVWLIPGDPAVQLAGGENATPAQIAKVREQLGLNDPFFVQYGHYLSRTAHLDFGKSMVDSTSVSKEIKSRLPVTLSIALAAAFVGLLIGVPAGIAAGMRPGSPTDRFAIFGSTIGIAIPNFWLAMLLVTFFSINLGLLPAVGFVPIQESVPQWLRTVTLPAIALGLFLAASMARQLRAALADVMQTSYVRTSWAKGASARRTVGKHALKNAAIPAITIFGLQLSGLIGGTIIIEQVFSIPGIGAYLLRAIVVKDIPVIQAVSIIFVLLYMFMNLLVDISYALLNPKVRIT